MLFKRFFLLSFLFLTSIFAIEKNQKTYKHPLVMCSMFKNEARFLKEWIEFHKLVGVTHFYLYNNRSEDSFMEVLTPYVESGEVTLIQWDVAVTDRKSWIKAQEDAFLDGVKKSCGVAKWAAFLDIDEFIVPVVKDSIVDVLNEYEDVPALVVNWIMFGTSDVEKIPENQLMTEVLVKRAKLTNEHHISYKSIVRPEYVEKPWTSHAFIYKKNSDPKMGKKNKTLYAVNENREVVKKLANGKPSYSKLQMNHYWTRDKEFFNTEKKDRLKKRHPYLDLEAYIKPFSVEKDETILRFLPGLRKAMKS